MAGEHETGGADLLGQPEAAAELRVSLSTLRRWEALDEGPPRIKIGKKVLYRKSSLWDWVLAHETQQAGEVVTRQVAPAGRSRNSKTTARQSAA